MYGKKSTGIEVVSLKVALLSAGSWRHLLGGWSLHPSKAGELHQ